MGVPSVSQMRVITALAVREISKGGNVSNDSSVIFSQRYLKYRRLLCIVTLVMAVPVLRLLVFCWHGIFP